MFYILSSYTHFNFNLQPRAAFVVVIVVFVFAQNRVVSEAKITDIFVIYPQASGVRLRSMLSGVAINSMVDMVCQCRSNFLLLS